MLEKVKQRATLILLILLALGIGVFHYFIKERPTPEKMKRLQERGNKAIQWQGKFPTDFEIAFLHGEKFRLSEAIGQKVIILNFFATWCGPCKAEMPELNRYYQKHRGEQFILIGIDAEEKEETVRKFVEDQKLDFPVGIDMDGTIGKVFGVEAYPTTLLIGADGKIALYEVGAISNADVAFRNLHEQSLELLSRNQGIDRETYQKKWKAQISGAPALDAKPQKEKGEEFKLEGPAKDFVSRLVCPDCGRRLLECEDRASVRLKKKLMTMDLKNRKDEDILKELFLTGPEK